MVVARPMPEATDEKTVAYEPTHPQATLNDEGFWGDEKGALLAVSASDLERYTYCPLSWSLATRGHAGKGKEIVQGQENHKEIHRVYSEYQMLRVQTKRNLIIWQWWYAIILVLVIDIFLFRGIDASEFSTVEISKLLVTWAISCLVVGIGALFLPWRQLVGMEITPRPSYQFGGEQQEFVEPYFEPRGFEGGWFEGGRIEVAFFMAAIVLVIHSLALRFASNREQATYVLTVVAIGWTLIATVQLQRALIANSKSLSIAADNDIQIGTEIAYSDDEKGSGLLMDNSIGLRGRPDQIVIIDGEFIPVEQKTGRVPKKPHDSHSMQVLAYAHLIEATTGRSPPYGMLRYGEENLHIVNWNDDAKSQLIEAIQTIQGVMANGGAKRNHNRPGKCKNCSRRYACPDPLTQ
ncbi:MAG: hypothetical protein CMA65_03770 [Euryarchaeota archaeon]|nr:hypothetical protein [Euryarchaeota archaeon]